MTHGGNDGIHDSGKLTNGGSAARPLGWVGAAFSVAMFAGIAIWGYELAIRDAGSVPVVRALEGPMRVQPDDPGGQQASHQGLTVNRVQEAGLAEPAADRLILAPEPIGVIENDSPVVSALVAENPGLDPPEEPFVPESTETPSETANSVDDLLRQVALDVSRSEPFNVTEGEEDVLASGLTVSPRPVPRPDPSVFTQVIARAEAAQPTPARTPEVDVARISAGTLLVQLGAFDSPDAARGEWENLEGQFGQYFEGKARVVQQAESGGRTFYRLRAMGFADLSDARRFCSVLLAEETACIPVVMR